MKCDHRSNFFFSNLSNWKEEAWKKSGLHSVRAVRGQVLLANSNVLRFPAAGKDDVISTTDFF